jgi:1-acyl-sn-glycerol-3-phosphate acyltransferase
MIRNLVCILTAVVWSAIMFFPSVLTGLFLWNSDYTMWWARIPWSWLLLKAGGATLEVQGLEHVDPKKPSIFVCNHQSTIDIPAVLHAIPVNFRFVAKSQLKWVPFIGWYLAAANHVFVDRSNHKKAIRSLEAAGQKIRGGVSILMFAEGSRSEDGRVLPFKKGPFALALQARVPVFPVTVEGGATLMPKNSWNITPGPVRVKIGNPIDAAAFAADDRTGLAKAVRDTIIRQSLELGGKGGDPDTVFAGAGLEGRMSAARAG